MLDKNTVWGKANGLVMYYFTIVKWILITEMHSRHEKIKNEMTLNHDDRPQSFRPSSSSVLKVIHLFFRT
jgi:hypothetical protein